MPRLRNPKATKKAKGSKEIYAMYCSTTKAPVAYNIFKEILSKYNRGMADHILDGGILHMGNNLSSIQVVRRSRDPRSPRINWGASFKTKAKLESEGKELFDKETGEGEEWLIYFTDTEYCRFKWFKSRCMVKNKSVYSFVATRGKDGNKEKLTALMNNDDLAYLKFTRANGDL